MLWPADAVAALLLTVDGHYVMQQRDDKPGIFFPGFWGNFGGAIDPGEDAESALFRELAEELGFAVTNRSYFCRLVLDFRYGGAGEVVRHFFTVTLTDQEIGRITLGEGQAVGVFSGEEVMAMAKVVP